MRSVELGRSGLKVSAIGLGGVQFSKVSAAQVKRVIAAALDEGINFLETAYGYFDSEEKMGPALRGRRDGLILASKSWIRDGATFAQHMETSLRRLGTDCIDLYQLHGVDSKAEMDACLKPGGPVDVAMRARQAGKIRSLGLTTHSLDIALKAAGMDIFESIQYPISLVNTEVRGSGLLGKAARNGVGLIAMKPLGGGRLGDPRLALGYVYGFRNVVPVVGVETPQQVKELAAIARRPPVLKAADRTAIARLRRTVGKRFCRACRYCEPCPQKITIFKGMYFPVYIKQMGVSRVLGKGLPDYLKDIEKCTACRTCEKRCPFGLDIVSGLKDSLALARELMAAEEK